MSDQSWSKLHDRYTKQDWINKPSLFAETAVEYFPEHAKILELGAGQGQDSRYFADKGFTVVSTDLEQTALNKSVEKMTADQKKLVSTQKVDLRNELPFDSESFDVVYAHLSIHYFDSDHTRRILDESARVLKTGGTLAFFVNSATDPEYGQGKELEPDYFLIESTPKRYFTVKTAREATQYNFDTLLLDDLGETYKDAAIGVHNLIRYVGTKKTEKPKWDVAVPYVGAIIQRNNGVHTEILLQTRWKPHADPVYSGTLEFPAGKLDKIYEDVHTAIEREILE
jgi:SAM-dependent methyltransferase